MCFSASVSFGAAVIIGATGAAGIKVASEKNNSLGTRLFAVIPLFFAVQQIAEGVLWLTLNAPLHNWYWPFINTATYGFLFFAWVIWPFYVPFSLRLMEKDPARKKLLTGLLILGSALSLVLCYVLFRYSVKASISDYHISYELNLQYGLAWLIAIWYILPTVITCFISSIKKMWIFGVVNFASYFIAKIFFLQHALSVWCFFAAISSVVVVLIIQEQNRTANQHLILKTAQTSQ